MNRLTIIVSIIFFSYSVPAQKDIVKIDTVHVKWLNDSIYTTTLDTTWCTYDYKGYENSLKGKFHCVFYGELKNSKPFTGKSYCNDEYGLLEKIEIYKEGVYIGNGVIEN